MKPPPGHPKVAIVGMGVVGSTLAYTLMVKRLVRELALIDLNPGRAEGEAMDLRHGLPFTAPVTIGAGGYETCGEADIVVITAGANQKEGQSRLDLAQQNADIVKSIAREILKHAPGAIFCMVSNPVDVLTYVFLKESGLPPSRVFGSGTVLDTSRLRYALSEHCGLDARNVHGYIIGEHGDSELPLWSRVNIAGVPLREYCKMCGRGCGKDVWHRMEYNVRHAAYEIIARKQATNYAVGLSVARILEAVLTNQHSVLTVSTLISGYRGISEVCLSLPCVLGKNGLEMVIDPVPDQEEARALTVSAQVLRRNLATLGY